MTTTTSVWQGAWSYCVTSPPEGAPDAEVVRSQRLRAVGELSLGVSHNLNNILTGVLGPAGLIQYRPMTAAFFTRSARR